MRADLQCNNYFQKSDNAEAADFFLRWFEPHPERRGLLRNA
jgi:hypothetical protein